MALEGVPKTLKGWGIALIFFVVLLVIVRFASKRFEAVHNVTGLGA